MIIRNAEAEFTRGFVKNYLSQYDDDWIVT